MGDEYKNRVIEELGSDYSITLIKLGANENVYKCVANDSEMIPNVLIVAVNKKTGKLGSSILSVDDAIRLSH